MKHRIDDSDLAQLVRLTFDLLCLADEPTAATNLALDRLCTITGAAVASLGVVPASQPEQLKAVHRFHPTLCRKRPRGIERLQRSDPLLHAVLELSAKDATLIIHPTTRLQRELFSGAEARAITTLRAGLGLGDGLYSVLPMQNGRVSVLSLHQGVNATQKWGSREVKLLDLLHPDLTWLAASIATSTTLANAQPIESTSPQPGVLRLALSRSKRRVTKRYTAIPRLASRANAAAKIATPSAA